MGRRVCWLREEDLLEEVPLVLWLAGWPDSGLWERQAVDWRACSEQKEWRGWRVAWLEEWRGWRKDWRV